MKKIILSVFIMLYGLSLFANEISGKWFGAIKIQGMKLRIAFNIKKTEKGYKSTMDSLDQNALGIKVKSTTYKNSVLKIIIPNLGINFEGKLKDGKVRGTFKQNGYSFPLVLSKKEIKKEILKRPQEPKKPYPYISEDVIFENKEDKIMLAGTLTLPKKKGAFPAVVLISGSGPQNRNEELMQHKPFLILSDYLTRNGIAVLRFDDRGTAKSKGKFKTATTYDFVKDVNAAFKYLQTRKEIDRDKIGLIGHSEGGIIAPILSAKNKDINFIVLMAGPAMRGDKLLLLQKKKIELKMGINVLTIQYNSQIFAGAYKIILDKNLKTDKLKEKLSDYFTKKYGTALVKEQKNAIIKQLTGPWMISFTRLDPAKYLKRVKCPVLVINGDKDLQVPSKENLAIMKKTLKNADSKSEIKELKNLNHLFQECKTGLPSEYGKIEQTISPKALKCILDWIKKVIK